MKKWAFYLKKKKKGKQPEWVGWGSTVPQLDTLNCRNGTCYRKDLDPNCHPPLPPRGRPWVFLLTMPLRDVMLAANLCVHLSLEEVMAPGFEQCLSLQMKCQNRLPDTCGMFWVFIFNAQEYTAAAWKWHEEGSKIRNEVARPASVPLTFLGWGRLLHPPPYLWPAAYGPLLCRTLSSVPPSLSFK